MRWANRLVRIVHASQAASSLGISNAVRGLPRREGGLNDEPTANIYDRIHLRSLTFAAPLAVQSLGSTSLQAGPELFQSSFGKGSGIFVMPKVKSLL